MTEIAEKIITIAEHFGTEHQEQKLIEEMGELLVEISKNMITGEVSNNTVSEFADVIILINELIYLYDLDVEYNNEVQHKIDRQILRIEQKKETKLLIDEFLKLFGDEVEKDDVIGNFCPCDYIELHEHIHLLPIDACKLIHTDCIKCWNTVIK